MTSLLQINSVVNTGSTGRIAEEIGQVAIVRGWKSYIAYGREARESKSELIRIGNDWDIKLHGLETRIFDNHGLSSRNSTKAFISEIERINPDIIHLHNIHGYYLNYNLLFNYLKTSNTPIVWTFHDCWPITGHCTYFDYAGCDKWQTQCSNCPQKNEYPASLLFDHSQQNYDLKRKLFSEIKNLTLVPVSEWIKKDVLLKSFLHEKKMKVIHNGVNIDIFNPNAISYSIKSRYDITKPFMILGVASEWPERKGLNDFIKLSQSITEDILIVLVGLSNKQMRFLPRNILGISRLDDVKELASLYASADVVLNLSSEESFGLTTVEGMACGTPSIVYNCTASPELVTSTTGIIVKKGSINGLVQAIMEIKDKGKAHYTAKCRERVLKYFNKADRYMDYINLYEEILQGKSQHTSQP